jgi:hypothetical protein
LTVVESHETGGPGAPIVCDVGGIGVPDVGTLETLVRLQLTALRMGTTIELHNACPALVELIAFAGLADALRIAGSGVEVHGQVEEGEQRGVDEEVLRGDDAP